MLPEKVERLRKALLEVENEKRKKAFDAQLARAACLLYDMELDDLSDSEVTAAVHDRVNKRMFHYLATKYLED